MRTKVNFPGLFVSLLMIAGVAGAQESESLVLVTQEDLPGWWTVAKNAKPVYPRSAFNNGKQGCAVIGFVIEADGTTSSYRVLFSYPDASFDQAAINAYKKWRFDAGNANPNRAVVFTTMTASFTWMDKEEDKPEMRQQLTSLCAQEGNRALQKMVHNAPG